MRFVRWLSFLFLALLLPLSARSASKPFEKLEGCQWKEDRWNDGDSFHIIPTKPSREIVARLYFVDSPEAETAYEDRLDEQAAYFAITRDQATQIAHEASAFTRERLSKPFTVWTRWHSALGRTAIGRVYCIIIDSAERDLNELLVENGLARIYGVRTPLADGRDSRKYLARLAELEKKAKAAKKGAWRFAGITAPVQGAWRFAETTPPVQGAPVSTAFLGSKNSEVFHKAGCKSVAKILPKNVINYQSRDEAIQSGKRPCAECKP